MLLQRPIGVSCVALARPWGTRSVFNLSRSIKALKTASSSSSAGSAQKYTISKRFQHPQPLMYALVSRVDLYHEFVPYCTSSFITTRDPATGQPTVAGLRVGFQAFDEEFTCELDCVPSQTVVANSISHSLFHFLETEWQIVPTDGVNGGADHCVATLNLRYEFKSTLYNHVSSLFAKQVAKLLTQAFERRAYEVARDDSLQKRYHEETKK